MFGRATTATIGVSVKSVTSMVDVDPQTTLLGDPMALRISTLGRFRVQLPDSIGGGEPVWSNSQSRTVLKLLLAAPDYRRPSEQLIELLWPEADPTRGREYLRDAVSRLRLALEPQRRPYGLSPYLIKDRESVGLLVRGWPLDTGGIAPHESNGEDQGRRASGIWLDAHQFELVATSVLQGLVRASPTSHETDSVLQLGHMALTLYRGAFLPTDVYTDWARSARARYFRLWIALLRHLADAAIMRREFEQAMLLLGHLVDASPDDEYAASRLMLVQGATGHRGEAHRTYTLLCDHLGATLGMPPAREIQLLAQTIFSSESQHELISLLDQGWQIAKRESVR